MKLSILICSMYNRWESLASLLHQINSTGKEHHGEIELLISSDNGVKSIGQKRNELLYNSKGKYVVFIDDDDSISDTYIEEVFKGINEGVDLVAITMMYQPSIGPHRLVSHSKDYTRWGESEGVYLRTAQHVCPIRRDIAIRVKYPEISFGEDREYSIEVNGLIETEYQIETPIYFYKPSRGR